MILSKHVNTIYSTGRNENGRTPFVMHKVFEGKPEIFHGEVLNSADDEKRMERIERDLEEARRDSVIKQHLSLMYAQEVILTS